MTEQFFFPLVAAVVGALVQVLFSSGTRSTLERRITFYSHREAAKGADREQIAAQRIRCQAQLHAMDHVQGALPTLGLVLVPVSGFYLFVAGRGLSDSPTAFLFNAVLGLLATFAAAIVAVANLNRFRLRKEMVSNYVAGHVLDGPPVTPFPVPGVVTHQERREFTAVALLLLASPLGLGMAWTLAGGANQWLIGGFVSVGVLGYAVLVFTIGIGWKVMHDDAERQTIPPQALRMFPA